MHSPVVTACSFLKYNLIYYILIREGIRFMPPFLSNVHVLRPSEPEKMVFANVSVSQPFLTNGSGFIHQRRFLQN